MKSSYRLGVFLALGLVSILLTGCAALQPQATAEPQAAQVSASTDGATNGEAIQIEKINLNDMTEEQLIETIPDIGENMIHEFFEYQPYVSIQQFRRDIGKYVDEEQVAFYEEYVFVPVDVNESDQETLMQIPGVDEAIAEALMEARPFDSNDAFLAVLSEHVSVEEVEAATPYLIE